MSWPIPDELIVAVQTQNALTVKLVRALESCAKQLQAIKRSFYRPGRLEIITKGRVDMAILFDVSLPPPGATDVVSRELTLTIDGTTQAVPPLVGTTTVVVGFSGPQGATVEAVLVDVDDAGNRSEPSPKLVATLQDTIPPPAPGELGLIVTGET